MSHATAATLVIWMTLLGVPIAMAVPFGMRTRWPAIVAIAWFSLTAAALLLAARTGAQLESAIVSGFGVPSIESITDHAAVGGRLWLLAVTIVLAVIVGLQRPTLLRLSGQVVAIALAIVLAVVTLLTVQHARNRTTPTDETMAVPIQRGATAAAIPRNLRGRPAEEVTVPRGDLSGFQGSSVRYGPIKTNTST